MEKGNARQAERLDKTPTLIVRVQKTFETQHGFIQVCAPKFPGDLNSGYTAIQLHNFPTNVVLIPTELLEGKDGSNDESDDQKGSKGTGNPDGPGSHGGPGGHGGPDGPDGPGGIGVTSH